MESVTFSRDFAVIFGLRLGLDFLLGLDSGDESLADLEGAGFTDQGD
jgi:hypothetical protein